MLRPCPMAFGKKKSSLPQPVKRSGQFNKKTRSVSAAPISQQPRTDEPDLDAMQTLTLIEVHQYSAGLCEARGFPEASCASIGMSAAWLAQRGLPSLSFISKTIFEHVNTDLRKRGPHEKNGMMHLPCPLLGTAFLGGYVDQLVEAGTGVAVNLTVGGPAILMASRLSDHAQRHKLALHMAISPLGRDQSNPTIVTVHQNEISIQPGSGSLYHPSHVTIRVVPPSHIPPPETFSSPKTRRKTTILQKAHIELIDMMRKAEGFPPVMQAAKATSNVPGLPYLKNETKDFFRQIIQTNYDLQQNFSALSKSDISGLMAAVTNNGGKDNLGNMVFATSAGSPNDKFYNSCKKLSWMTDYYDKTMSNYNIKSYALTKTGRMGLSVLMERYMLERNA